MITNQAHRSIWISKGRKNTQHGSALAQSFTIDHIDFKIEDPSVWFERQVGEGTVMSESSLENKNGSNLKNGFQPGHTNEQKTLN